MTIVSSNKSVEDKRVSMIASDLVEMWPPKSDVRRTRSVAWILIRNHDLPIERTSASKPFQAICTPMHSRMKAITRKMP